MMRSKRSFPVVVVVVSSLCVVAVAAGFDSFMDNVYFDLKWPGREEDGRPIAAATASDLGNSESVEITTNNNERYRCVIPNVAGVEEQNSDDTSSSVIELDLLKPLFDQSTCTYRLETYWTYELCHGRHLRQYHEEKEMGKKPKLQEYYLGRYKMETFHAEYELAKQAQAKADQKLTIGNKMQKVQGIEIPYYEVVFTDGTTCDLNGKPRKAYLHYVCEPEGRGEIYELKETSSCEYEVVVLSSQLCSHPAYGQKKEPSNVINCHSLGSSPRRPQNLELLEQESSLAQFNSRQFWNDEDAQKFQDDGQLNHLWDLIGRMLKETEMHHDLLFDPEESSEKKKPPPRDPGQEDPRIQRPPVDNQILKEFLDGSFCIEGGTGWWKHKFCYGRQVVQFHIDNLRRDVIVLGTWNEENHLKWINANPSKRPKPLAERRQINLFYSNGDMCDITGHPRVVEVKLRCLSNPVNANAVSIYLNEPKVCEYTLTVESSILCDLVALADDNGLVEKPNL